MTTKTKPPYQNMSSRQLLVESSIRRVPLHRQEFAERLGIPFNDVDCLNDNNDNNDQEFSFSLKWNRKTPRATVRQWLDKLGRRERRHNQKNDNVGDSTKQQQQKNLTATSRCIGNHANCRKELYRLYVDKALSDGKYLRTASSLDDGDEEIKNDDNHNDTDDNKIVVPKDELGGVLGYNQGRSSNSLAYYRNGNIFEGEITTSSSNDDSIFECAANLYNQLWWFRAVQGLAVSRVYGFVIRLLPPTSPNRSSGVVLTLLCLELPDLGPIGGRFQLNEYTETHNNDNNKDRKKDLTSLGQFITSDLTCGSGLPNDSGYHDNPFSMPTLQKRPPTPGAAMLLPLWLWDEASRFPWEFHSDDDNDNGDGIENRGGNGNAFQVIPTANGSLVIRIDATAVTASEIRKLLFHQECSDNDTIMSTVEEDWVKQISSCAGKIQSGHRDDADNEIWYVKCKTPASFGTFYDTANLAITSSRRILQSQIRPVCDKTTTAAVTTKASKTVSRDEETAVAMEWLHMHPVDAWVSPHRSLSLVRGMGVLFVGPSQLTWKGFAAEMLSLMRRTLLLQRMCRSLVHGDIYHANVLWNATACEHHQLVLIDWDEALRPQPCYRTTTTDEEKERYPSGLVGFPEHYTKHQLIHLCCQHYLTKLYHKELLQTTDSKKEKYAEFQFRYDGINAQDMGLIAAVDARFKLLSNFLRASCE